MAPVHYTGALQPKKKSELQEIALALRLNDQGTKDELQARIKKHLDGHQSELEDDPIFAGLLGRRKRSVQPQSANPALTRASDLIPTEPKPPSRVRRSGVLEPVLEATPAKDLTDVSAYLKQPISPAQSTPNQTPHRAEVTTSPSRLPPLPPSPSSDTPASPAKTLIESVKTAADPSAIVHSVKESEIMQSTQAVLAILRQLLSNSRNIFTLTASIELLHILFVLIPWRSVQLPLSPKGTISLPYPSPTVTLQTSAFWVVILHWCIPVVLAPTIVGSLISFNPAIAQRQPEAMKDAMAFDPLTASITRLAAQIAYPFCSLDLQSGICGLDVIGFKLRVWYASLALAFAFAETISGAPQAFAQTLRRDRRFLTPSRAGTPMPVTGPNA